MSDTLSTPVKAIQGEDIETYEIPLLRKLYGRPGMGTLFGDYYRSADAVRITEKEARHYIEIGDRSALADLKRERRGEYSLIDVRRRIESNLRKLRQHRNKIKASSLSDSEKRRRLDRVSEKMQALMNRFNKIHNERVEE